MDLELDFPGVLPSLKYKKLLHIDFLTQIFRENLDQDVIIWQDQTITYQWLFNQIQFWEHEIDRQQLSFGAVVALEGDFSPNSIALFLALTKKACIIVPLHHSTPNKQLILEIAQAEFVFHVDQKDEVTTTKLTKTATHGFYQLLRKSSVPGLVLFSSGTSGAPKAAVHDFSKLLSKFKQKRYPHKMLNFLLFDHWGGLNTMLHTLSNAGKVLTVVDRSPDGICQFIEKHQVEILPTSPTFLNLLLLGEAYKSYDLSSLKTISYGTEPMASSTLKKIGEIFPNVRLLQTYGLIEVGVLRSKSKSSDSLWVKVGGEGYKTRVVDGILQIHAHSAMLGYLNYPSPFTEDGWFITGDSVEVDGEYIKILGRKSEIINVGGEKVYPADVESVIQEIENVDEVTVYGEKNPIIGNIVCARVTLAHEEDQDEFTQKLKQYCRERMKSFKVPVKVEVVYEKQYGVRYKKIRNFKIDTN